MYISCSLSKIDPLLRCRSLKSRLKLPMIFLIPVTVSFKKFSESSDTSCDSFQKLNSLSIYSLQAPTLSPLY